MVLKELGQRVRVRGAETLSRLRGPFYQRVANAKESCQSEIVGFSDISDLA